MKPERVARRWRRRHAKLLAALPELLRKSRAQGGPEEVHQLRVTLRRLRLSMRLAKGVFEEELVARLRSWAAKISRATSPVRDFDIAVDWLRACKAGPALVRECEKRRNSVWRRRRRQLHPLPPGLAAGLDQKRGGKRVEASIETRFRKLEERYREHLGRQLPRFFQSGEEDRHEFRRVVRWWRYLREMTLSKRKVEKDALLAKLLAAQEGLGEIQNLALVEAAFRQLTPSAELGELRSLLVRQQQAQIASAQKALAALKPGLR